MRNNGLKIRNAKLMFRTVLTLKYVIKIIAYDYKFINCKTKNAKNECRATGIDSGPTGQPNYGNAITK